MSLLVATACGSDSTTLTQNAQGDDDDDAAGDCTFTQGYWKNHEEVWEGTSITLGSVTYTQEQALAIFRTPVRGNGLVSLAHQLMAAKLNVANGAADGDIADDIAAADALIGDLVVPPIGDGRLETSATSALVEALDVFNNTEGDTCNAPAPSCGDGNVDAGEDCDDGNNADGDGCSANCTKEAEPCCGDGHVDAGETCDDGNTTSGDGCSSTCQTELVSEPEPCCGDGHLDPGEECDDGNTVDGDGCSSTCVCEPTPLT